MALRTLGWLSDKMGVDITGQAKPKEKEEPAPSSGPEGYMSAMSEAIFGGGGRTNDDGTTDGAAVDENGLPVSRDWYRYDDAAKMWVPTEHAPEWVKKEHADKVAAAREEREIQKFPDPPPPPPPPPPATATTGLVAPAGAPLAPGPQPGPPGLAPPPAGAVAGFPPPPAEGALSPPPARSPITPVYADAGFFKSE